MPRHERKKSPSRIVSPGTALFAALALAIPQIGHGAVAIVVNSKSNLTSITISELKAVYLGVVRSAGGQQRVLPVDQPELTEVHQEFYRKVIGKTGFQLKSHWAQLVFTGKAVPPATVADNGEVKKWLQTHPDGIGYLQPAAADSTVRVLMTIE